MSTILVWALLAPVVLGVGALALLAWVLLVVVGGARTGRHPGITGARWLGLVIGAGVAVVLVLVSGSGMVPLGRLGLGALAALAPLVGAIVLVLAVALGERRLVPDGQERRYGGLIPRGPLSALPVVPLGASVLAVLALLVLTVCTTRIASPDDAGRSGREISARSAHDGMIESMTHSPFPGSWYTVPVWIVLAALLIVAGIVIARVLRRRRSEDPADLLLRRRTTTSVLGAVALGTGVVTVGLGVITAFGLRDAARLETLGGAMTLTTVTTLLGALTAVLGLAMVLAPAPFAPADPEAARGRVRSTP